MKKTVDLKNVLKINIYDVNIKCVHIMALEQI